ncbi:MAG: NADH-quinone oxidoreductase subunit M [Candidatus Altiarchaeales archaeon]|nr:NADH-quinone oxidoreductase subunit M [Candidatus Altiarchaeales archaeon]MBD3415903.1 NADH-quinone oxidoreductase subunit M [Candidatus Altiarchaeales archaeon]
MLVESLAVLAVAFTISLFISGLERKIQAHIQQRRGPPLTTPGLWSVIKFLHKEPTEPDSPSSSFYKLLLVLNAVSLVFILLFTNPLWYGVLGFSSLLGLLGLLKLEEVSYMLMGSLSRSVMSKSMPFPDTIAGSKLGGARSYFEDVAAVRSLKMITFGSFPFYIALLMPFAHVMSMDVEAVLAGPPLIFTLSGLVAAFIYFIGYNMLINNRPFDIIKPKIDVIEGPVMEYAAGWRGMYYLKKGFSMFVLSSVFVTLFIGVPPDLSDPGTLVTHMCVALAFPVCASILKAYSPVFTFKQIYPISLSLTVLGVLALTLNIIGF